MFIKQIEIQGFKSFPEKTKIIFHPGVTIIVGPNGCGKSNIVDSVLWVLGEQRLKNIRGDRTEDIIFNGNSRRPPLGMVYVSLIIGNEEKELIIEHRAFRDGESEYKLNGKRVRLKEIQDALWAEGIGEKEYFVISQGNINQIVTAKPAERRLFLEEAAGIGKYRERKRQTQNKLFESEQNLIRLEDIIAEVEKQKNLLKRQASAARRYRILRERIRTLSFVYFREKIKDLRKNQKEVLENYHEFFGKEKEIFKRIKSEEIKFTKIENNIWNQENILKKLRSNLFSLNSRISKLIALKEKEEKRLEYLKDRIQKAKSDLKENNYELGQLEDRTQKLTEEENTLEKIYKNKEIEAEGIRKKHNSIKEELEKLQDEIRRREEEKINLQQDLISLRNEILITNKEKENLSNQIRKSINDLEGENKLLENKKQNLTQIEKEFTALKNSLKKSKEKITSLEDQIGKYKNLIESIKKNLQEKREKLQNVLNQLKFYEKLKKETSPTQSENNTMLVEFIEVESDYLKPADAFWKEELKAIPIEIKDLINLLNNKVNLKGFFLLPKENIKSESNIPQGILNESNVLGILKAKIKIKQKYQKFLFSLQDAVVMKDMNSALNLWLKYPEVNFITLEGDIILKNGLIKFSQEEGILKIQKQIKEALKSKKVLEREISLLESNLKEKKGELETLISELNNENNSYSEYERKYLEKSKDYEFLKKEIENLKNRVNVFKQELEISQKEEKLLEEKINKLYLKEKEIQKKISEEDKLFFQTKKKFSELQEKFKNISEESIKINGEINLIQEKMKNLTNTLNSLKERKKKLKDKIKIIESEIDFAERDIDKIKKFLSESELKINELTKKEKEIKEEIERLEETLKSKKLEYKGKEKKLNELRENYEKIKEERIKWEIKKAELERDLINLEKKCWDELNRSIEEIEKEEIEKEEKLDLMEIEEELEKAKKKLDSFKEVNMMAEEEYRVQEERYDFLIQQKNDLLESINSTHQAIEKIDEESKELFLKAFNEVNENFKKVFNILFGGGRAGLKLTNKENPLESGIEIIAQPPGKRLQNLMLFSGGEKTLISLAFLFALFQFKPSPFCILDEVDATLDDANLTRFLNFIEQLKEKTQFLIVTHNLKTMEIADYIYGVTMTEPNVSSLYSIKLEKK